MLAIITKMTLTQVSTWFANARRRLKKENKMTWSPKNKANDDRKEDLNKSDPDCATKGLSTLSEESLLFLLEVKLRRKKKFYELIAIIFIQVPLIARRRRICT